MRGVQLFPSTMPPAARRRRSIFLGLWLAIGAMLVWPIYPQFAGTSPRLLGLPMSFAWVVIALVLMFFALLWLFVADSRDRAFIDSERTHTADPESGG